LREILLRAESLSIGYARRPSNPRVLASDINLTLRAGELVCLLGPNGAGKSTFLRTVSGLQPPLRGRVLIGDRDAHHISAMERARAMSVVLTDRISAGMLTSYDIVSLGRQPHTDWRGRLTVRDHEVIRQCLEAVGAVDLAPRLVAELSDGERQRVLVGRALAQQPRLMVLDEITAFLDLPRRIEMMQLLQRLAHRDGTAVLLSTHDLDLALRTADQLWLVAGDGRVESGAPEDLVLAGVVERTFATATINFDLQNGTFGMRKPETPAVAVHGSGAVAHWTARAIERAGYRAVGNDEGVKVRVHAPSGDNNSWRLCDQTSECLLGSLSALVDQLRMPAARRDHG
jgi:iron complex transport system ATP-binding protein